MNARLLRKLVDTYPRGRLRLITVDAGYYDLGSEELEGVRIDYDLECQALVCRFEYRTPKGLLLFVSAEDVARVIVMPEDSAQGAVPPDLDGPDGMKLPEEKAR